MWSFGIEHKPNTIKNPQANIILECLRGLLGNMLHKAGLEGKDNINPMYIEQFIIDAAWVICSTHYIILGSSLRAAVFGQDMLFNLLYITD